MKKVIIILLSFLTSPFIVNAQFGELIDVSKSLRPYLISVADFNNDSLNDFVLSQQGNITWLENQGSSFLPHIIVPDSFSFVKQNVIVLKTGDFDNNGFEDIIYSDWDANSYTGKLVILYNQNGINFTSSKIDNLRYYTLNIDDLDGDGDIDIIASNYNSNVMYINNGVSNFSKSSFRFGTSYVCRENRIVDLDGDSLLDLVSFERYPYTSGYQGFIVYLDVATNQVGYQVGNLGFCKNLVVKDINNDNKPDILFIINKYLCSYKNIDSLNWSVRDTLYQFTGSFVEDVNSLWVEDFRNDNNSEIIFYQDNKLSQLIYNGTNYEETEIDSSYNLSDLSPYFIDMNNDGLLDIVSSGGSLSSGTGGHYFDKNHVSILISQSGNNFNRNIIFSDDADIPTSAIAVDIDNDGDKDISVTIVDKQVYYENIGNNNFSSYQNVMFEGQFKNVISNDFNGDGLPDFIALNGDSLMLIYFENQGNNTFNPSVLYQYNSGYVNLLVVDYDMDGDIDVCLNNNYDFYMIDNLTGGNFGSPSLIFNKTAVYHDMKFADFTNNGYPDLIYTYSYMNDRNLSFVKNNNGIFTSNDSLITNVMYGNSPIQMKINHIYDYDNDGDLDLFVNDYDELMWVINDSGYPTQVVKTLTGIRMKNTLDIDDDNDIDFIYEDPSLPYYQIALNDNNTYSEIPIIQKGVYQSGFYPSGNFYFDDFDNNNNSLKDIIYLGGHDLVGFLKNKTHKIGKVEGYVFYDQNQNKLYDSTEVGLSFINTFINPQSLSSYSNNGYYSYLLDSGVYQLSLNNNNLWNITTDSIIYNLNLNNNLSYDSLLFGLYPDTIITIIQPDLTGGFPRCNDIVNYWLSIQNLGTTLPDGYIHLQLDDSITYLSSNIIPDSVYGQNLYWDYDSLFFYSFKTINIQVKMPPFTSMGDTLSSFFTVYELDNNNIVYSKSDTLEQILVCAYDPNDKTVIPKGLGTSGYVFNNQELEYLVRFQNTGNDTAHTIVIKDNLDDNLNWNSLYLISSSNDIQINIDTNGLVIFKFENIMLPDSGADFLGSQGYVKFRINMNSNLLPDTEINNTAHIYFDANPAIITNNVLNTIYDCSNINLQLTSASICQNEKLIGNSYESEFSDTYWEIDSIYSSNNDSLIWSADTVGTFDLKLTINNSLCNKDTLISITVNPSSSSSSTIEICQNDSIFLGGNYQNTSGIYYDTLQTILGCDSVMATTLTVNPTFVTQQSLSICQNDSIFLGGNYQNTSGTYYDSLQTILGCDSVVETTLLVNSLPTVNLNSFNPDTLCNNSNPVALPIGTPSGGIYSGNGISGNNFDPSSVSIGTHNIIYTFTDNNSCINSDTTSVYVVLCTNIEDVNVIPNIRIYPNPNTGKFIVEKINEFNQSISVKLLDGNSKLIIDKTILNNQDIIEFDITNYSKGLYYLHIIIDNNTFVKKILKN